MHANGSDECERVLRSPSPVPSPVSVLVWRRVQIQTDHLQLSRRKVQGLANPLLICSDACD